MPKIPFKQLNATDTFNMGGGRVILPHGATVPVGGVEGEAFWDDDGDVLYVHDGTTWVAQTSGGSGGPLALADLTDVSNSDTPAKNDVMKFNGTEWVFVPYNTSFTFDISTFVCNAGATGTVFEMGTGNWKAIGAASFTATYLNGPATGGYVAHTGWTPLTLGGVGFVGPTVNAEAITFPSVGGTKVFTLNATDGTDNDTLAITYYFYNRRFWGKTTSTSGFTEATVEGLASNELSNSRAKTFSSTTSTGEYILYAYPSRLGTATFTVGGFSGGFQAPETVSVTNASGYTENYYVYRSDNANLGTISVVVS